MVALLDGPPISTEELCQSDHWVLGHLPDQGSSPSVAQFGRVDSSGKSLGGSNLIPIKNDARPGSKIQIGSICDAQHAASPIIVLFN
jgi:hypothetical protein